MKKNAYYKPFMQECIANAGDREICIWGARKTGRNLLECVLEHNMVSAKKIHLMDRALYGKIFI